MESLKNIELKYKGKNSFNGMMEIEVFKDFRFAITKLGYSSLVLFIFLKIF